MPAAVRNSLVWIFDAFENDETYFRKRMFGFDAAYVDGRQCLVAADREAPWSGLLICTSRAHHATLIAEMPSLTPHAVLGKWLYVPQDDPTFEFVVEQIVHLVLGHDGRIGIEPKPRPPRRKSIRSKSLA